MVVEVVIEMQVAMYSVWVLVLCLLRGVVMLVREADWR